MWLSVQLACTAVDELIARGEQRIGLTVVSLLISVKKNKGRYEL